MVCHGADISHSLSAPGDTRYTRVSLTIPKKYKRFLIFWGHGRAEIKNIMIRPSLGADIRHVIRAPVTLRFSSCHGSPPSGPKGTGPGTGGERD